MLKAVSGEDKSDDADWTDWCMKDLVLDLYRLRYAERLALKDIPETRLAAYRYLFDRARISPLRSPRLLPSFTRSSVPAVSRNYSSNTKLVYMKEREKRVLDRKSTRLNSSHT